LIKSKSTALNGYDLVNDNNTQQKHVLLYGIMQKANDDFAVLGAIEAYLRAEGFGSDFGLSNMVNLPIWLRALEAINDILLNFSDKLSLDVNKVYESLTERVKEIKDSLTVFASNTRLIEFLAHKVIEQYDILIKHSQDHKAKAEFKDSLLDFTTLSNQLFSEEQIKKSLQKTNASFYIYPSHGCSTRIEIDSSEIFFKMVYPRITNDLGITSYLHTLSSVIFMNTEIRGIPENINNPELLKLNVCYEFSVIKENTKFVFATIEGEAHTGGLKTRHNIYQSLYKSVPALENYLCMNMVNILVSFHNGVRSEARIEHNGLKLSYPSNPVLTELLQRIHSELLTKPSTHFKIQITPSNAVAGLTPEILNNRDRAIKASMYVERTKLATSLAKIFQTEPLKKSSLYTRLLNIILNLRGSTARMPDMLQEFSKLLAGLTSDADSTKDFEQILQQMRPPQVAQLEMEEPNFTTNEILAELNSYVYSYEQAAANNTASLGFLG